jgi:hypothetical protein
MQQREPKQIPLGVGYRLSGLASKGPDILPKCRDDPHSELGAVFGILRLEQLLEYFVQPLNKIAAPGKSLLVILRVVKRLVARFLKMLFYGRKTAPFPAFRRDRVNDLFTEKRVPTGNPIFGECAVRSLPVRIYKFVCNFHISSIIEKAAFDKRRTV